jgi:hypothetical protein
MSTDARTFEAAVAPTDWTVALRRYLWVSICAHLVWEVLQLPLYTIWTTDPWPRQVWAVLHCTAGDAMIAGLSLLIALAIFATPSWPNDRTISVFAVLLVLGIVYTIYSEWMNTTVRANWAYSDLMPIVPILSIGLTPLLQWLIIPALAMWVAIGCPRNCAQPND